MTPSNDETDIVLPAAARPTRSTPTPRRTPVAASRPGRSRVSRGLTAADHSTIDALNAGTALLLVQHGPTSGARFLLDAEVTTVGRHPGNDIFLDDVTVSRKHAQFLRTASGFAVRDVGSLNGTYVGAAPDRRRRAAATRGTRCRWASSGSSTSSGRRARPASSSHANGGGE